MFSQPALVDPSSLRNADQSSIQSVYANQQNLQSQAAQYIQQQQQAGVISAPVSKLLIYRHQPSAIIHEDIMSVFRFPSRSRVSRAFLHQWSVHAKKHMEKFFLTDLAAAAGLR